MRYCGVRRVNDGRSSMYNRVSGSRSVVVCGGSGQSGLIASCEELTVDVNGLPAVNSWSYFASLPNALYEGCMLQVNGKVRHCPASLFA